MDKAYTLVIQTTPDDFNKTVRHFNLPVTTNGYMKNFPKDLSFG
jgi:hypothetical protein